MNWPREYLAAIKAESETVSNKVRAVYEREVWWMDSPPSDFPFYFDEAAGQRPIDFIEKFCKHYEGKWGGQSRAAHRPVDADSLFAMPDVYTTTFFFSGFRYESARRFNSSSICQFRTNSVGKSGK